MPQRNRTVYSSTDSGCCQHMGHTAFAQAWLCLLLLVRSSYSLVQHALPNSWAAKISVDLPCLAAVRLCSSEIWVWHGQCCRLDIFPCACRRRDTRAKPQWKDLQEHTLSLGGSVMQTEAPGRKTSVTQCDITQSLSCNVENVYWVT